MVVDAHMAREKSTMEKIAWHAANLMNDIRGAVSGRRAKRVSVDKLLGRQDQQRTYSTAAEMNAAALAHNEKILAERRAQAESVRRARAIRQSASPSIMNRALEK